MKSKLLLSLIALTVAAKCQAGPMWPILLIDGQNNHAWQQTTPVLKAELENSGAFQVTVVTSPGKDSSMAGFSPAFTNYAAVVLNYNGADWPKATQTNFENYVRNGGGMVSVHAADNAFPAWPEYNKMIGVGGWGGRNASSGVMLRWRVDGVDRDSGGGGGTHGRFFSFVIDNRAPENPIMNGIPAHWLHARDELYATLVGPAENVTVLATSRSDVTQQNEPMLMTIRYGKGRVFHTTLGHSVESMLDVGFATTLQRGTEWAATGEVHIPVPKEFPTAEAVMVWKPVPMAR